MIVLYLLLMVVWSNHGNVINKEQRFHRKLEVKLVRYHNPASITFDGTYCDSVLSTCDPRFMADLDVETPFAAWPGSKKLSEFLKIFEVANQDFISFPGNISLNVCSDLKAFNLRVQIIDVDPFQTTELVGEFECLADFPNGIKNPISSSTDKSEAAVTSMGIWSPQEQCRSLHPTLKHGLVPSSLFFRYRVVDLNEASTC